MDQTEFFDVVQNGLTLAVSLSCPHLHHSQTAPDECDHSACPSGQIPIYPDPKTAASPEDKLLRQNSV